MVLTTPLTEPATLTAAAPPPWIEAEIAATLPVIACWAVADTPSAPLASTLESRR